MSRERITKVVAGGRLLVSDGAWGTFLHAKGLKSGECPEQWNLTHPDDVYEVAKSYINAGSDMVQTNSFGGSRFKLEHYGLGDKTSQINEAAADISRKAAGDNNWVIASLGPTGKMLVTGEVTEEVLYDVFNEQARALEKGGADAICIETMYDLGEANQAIKAVKENTGCEVISTFTFQLTKKGEYRTMMGTTPQDFARSVLDQGADIIGTNCGNGMERMIPIVRAIREVDADVPILVHANAGLPENVDGKDVFPEQPADTASFVNDLINAGVNIIGGCCGTTPDHITAIKAAINSQH
ncbi:MAG: homocysteine S-methyltransferase family protein [Proteobacteria bacterium]|nr:homocysteine S-methyltransferase family protein [Pseudomonadota bacterium]